ncbi:MAG: hypothetical protein SVP52_06450 [Chloroflexota bacterium]|nr:hypothetical protein [Chloroflexota bacterium]
MILTIFPARQASIGEIHLIHIKAAFLFNFEDIVYYTKEIPVTMFWLGAENPEEKKFARLHTPDFDIDESSLFTGIPAMTALLTESLHKYSSQKTIHTPKL